MRSSVDKTDMHTKTFILYYRPLILIAIQCIPRENVHLRVSGGKEERPSLDLQHFKDFFLTANKRTRSRTQFKFQNQRTVGIESKLSDRFFFLTPGTWLSEIDLFKFPHLLSADVY